MLKHTFHAIWMLFVTLLFLTAVVLTVARIWVPSLNDYRVEIENAASQALDRQVSIGGLEVTWRGLGPVLKLKNIHIESQDADHDPLDIGEIWVTIDTDHYLAKRAIKIAAVDLIGAELVVIRDASGEIYLDGFRQEDSDTSLLEGLKDMHRLSVHDVNLSWIDRQNDAAPRRFSNIALSLNNEDYRHSVTGHALLPEDVGYRVDVEAELFGNSAYPKEWQGRVYAKGQSVSLATLLGKHIPAGMTLQGITDARVWADFVSLEVRALSGEIDTRELRIEHAEGDRKHAFKADMLSGQFGWRSSDQGWQFAMQQLHVRQQQEDWEIDNLSLAGTSHQDVNHINGVSSLVALDGFGALLPLIPGLAEDDRQLLAGLQPRGLINDLIFGISVTDQSTRVTGYSADFSGLGISQSGAIPMIAGLDGSVSGSMGAGTLTLDGRNVAFHDTNLFRDVFSVERVLGDIYWHRDAQRLEVGSDALAVSNNDLSLGAEFALDIPATDGGVSMNLALDVETADLSRIHHYLPARVMPARGVAWLDRSFKSGLITNGSIVVNGRFDQVPFDNGEGKLEVRLPVTSAVLDFHEDWSPVTGLDAQVDFTGRVMDIHSSRGAIRSASLESVHAQILNLAKPNLTINGEVQGQLPVMLAELGSSPLGEIYGGFVDRVIAGGDTALGLDIVVPLAKKNAPVEVSGRISLDDNTLKVRDSDIDLQGISGRLDFNSKGIKGKKLHARLFGHPATARVWTEPGTSITNISLDGPLQLMDRFLKKDSLPGSAISGSSDWQVLLALRGMPARGKKADIGLTVTSSLVGTTIDLPEPLGKDATSTREIVIVAEKIDEPVKMLGLRYGKVLEGLLKVAINEQGEQSLQQGVISVGGKKPVLPDLDELLFIGDLEKFHLVDWQPHLKGGDSPGLPVKFALHVDELEVFGYLMNDVSVDMEEAGLVWHIKADGPDVAGDVHLARTGSELDKVTLNMERLALDSSRKQQSESASEVKPGDLPDLQVSLQQLVFDQAELGLFELKTVKQPDSTVNIERLVVSSDLLSLRMNGNWKQENGEQVSSVNLVVSDGDMEAIMELLGYQKSIRDGRLTGSMQAAWPGAPWDFSPPAVDGKIRIKVLSGQLLDVEPGATGRVLGLLSLNNLPRRLLLDFSDLFAEGFSFDKIKGSFVIDGGNAYTTDLYVDGPPARIDISGRIGLAEQDYDELVTVTPYVKTGISLAGALAAGPAVGAILMMAETLLEGRLGPLNRIAQTQYTVTGPWADPVITKLTTKEKLPEPAADETGE
jgi:uncharacterized protein (TIGR02099 family)